MRQPNSELDQWFAAEILPHEMALNRYIRRIWSNSADVADLRQDIYIRVYERALQERPHQPKSFLFAVARNLLSDRIRRGRIVSIEYTQDLDALNVLIDEVSPEQHFDGRQQLQRLLNCVDRLPDRCREAIWLRRIAGLSELEAAQQLGIRKKTLAGYLSRGLSLLTRQVLGEELPGSATHSRNRDAQDTEHGW